MNETWITGPRDVNGNRREIRLTTAIRGVCRINVTAEEFRRLALEVGHDLNAEDAEIVEGGEA